MEQSVRFSGFYNRVDFERAVLRTVNKACGAVSLHGLTPDARSLWLRDAPDVIRQSPLPRLLDLCWEELGKMSDQSRNVFEVRPERPDVRVGLLAEIQKLRLF
jgi:hypothetical protein